MATNLQIYALRTDADLLKRIEVAVARYATYIRGLGENATPQQRAWSHLALEQGQSSAIAQACAWEAVNNPILRDAVYEAGLPGVPDTGANSLQVVVESIVLAYGFTVPPQVQR